MVELHGYKWKMISEELGRMQTNCRDKWRSLGGDNYHLKGSGKWKFAEIVNLIRIIEVVMKIKILKYHVKLCKLDEI